MFLICAKGPLMVMHAGKIVNLQCLLFYISNTNGKSYEINLLGLSTLNILENNIVNSHMLSV